ncbi:nitrite reductase large subunit NirB [Roseomonas sp. GC11]|uniref:nitrite reductase large subunit NirB n=1 Tax=Roseomonas sp. GC11 TaxID=2950546 RepID=UPI00210C6B2A|nr:nitrite reductase large subunit NirB [Roseomonas sp. GC11]MCQ4161543.1 nitrite reductase large subunit NirB [Roseomonas sp. GC11]
MNALPPQRQRLVVVGNGMAGMRTVEEILARAPGRFDITVFGAEPHPNYNRIMLSPLLAGEKSFDDIIINSRDWYAEHGIELIAGEKVVAVDRESRVVTGACGTARRYDVLLLATGSDPFIIPVPGHDLPGVVTFRDMADVEAMLAACARGGRAVVIGGGLLGLEAANGLARNGMATTVLHLMPHLMERQLDPVAAALLKADLEARGLAVRTGADTAAILGDGHVTAVRLKDGTELPADLVVMAVGIRPNAALGRAIGLACQRGIVVDDTMRTSDPAIFAVGECAEHRGVCHGLVAPLWDMAKVAADHIAAVADSLYAPAITGTRLKVTGIEMFSAGDFSGGEGCEEVVFRDPSRGVYRRLVLREQKLSGVVLYGDAQDGGWYFDLLKQARPLGALRDVVIFGQAVALASQAAAGGAAQDPKEALAALPDTAEICGCNGVCKGTILSGIREKSLSTLEEVRAHTKASASCGSCTKQVEGLLALALGAGYAAPAEKAMCRCTEHGHDHVRREILARKLKKMPEVMRALGWKTADGCHHCRPALNFYLLCAWPGEYQDDAQSRFVNERNHANIQKDGTYSVVPRMWGGVTTAAELRAIADVVDRYAIPTVKVTGGQRIDLLGVKREQLPEVWRDLNAAGMVSGHAYAKGLRTVKTCVGSEWCRFGTQDSTTMGIALERMTWGSWHPHKVKLAVSGCPRNCAESTIKDFGVIAVESGWELHIAGNGGIHLRGTDFLCKVTTPDEVLEYCAAFLQLYREEARYLDRTAPWVERVGLDYVKRRIVEDAAGRQALRDRFLYAQRFMQTDPWAERVADAAAARPFTSLAAAE